MASRVSVSPHLSDGAAPGVFHPNNSSNQTQSRPRHKSKASDATATTKEAAHADVDEETQKGHGRERLSLTMTLRRLWSAAWRKETRTLTLLSLVAFSLVLWMTGTTGHGHETNTKHGFLNFPRIFHHDPTTLRKTSTTTFHQQKKYPIKKRQVYLSSDAQEAQERINRSKTYRKAFRDPLHEGDCVPMRSWQQTMFPTCNPLHEISMDVFDVQAGRFGYLTRGGYNDIFTMRHQGHAEYYVFKQLRGPDHTKFTDRNFDRARRDALLMERLSKSPYIMDIYAYCGFGILVAYGEEGHLGHLIHDPQQENPMDPKVKLHLAAQVAMALAHAHDTDGDGISAMSHGDYAAKQYIFVNGVYKLNDFNRGRFIRWNEKKMEPCTYTIGKNDGKFRSPEEYKYTPQSSKIDVWALGSILYEIYTGNSVWYKYDEDEARQRLIDGKKPPLPSSFRTGALKASNNNNKNDTVEKIYHQAFLRVLYDMCFVYDPEKRALAGEVSKVLNQAAEELGVDVHRPIGFHVPTRGRGGGDGDESSN